MSSADKLSSGKWRVRVSTGKKNSKGNYIYKTFIASTKREAEKMASEYKLGKNNPNSGTIGATLQKYIEMRSPVLSPTTVKSYMTILKMLENNYPEIFTLSCNDLTSNILQQFINDLQSKRSPKTVYNYHGLLSAVMKTQGLSMPDVALPSKIKPITLIPSNNEIRLILEAAKNTELEIPILLAAFGPLRRGEICALQMDDIEGDIIHVHKAAVLDASGHVVIKTPKTLAGDRYLRLNKKIIQLINKKGYITKFSLSQISKHFDRLIYKLKLPKYHFHSLRHYCASQLASLNIPEAEILRRGGWESADVMKNIYRHATHESSIKADKIVNEVVDKIIDI